MAPPPNKKKPKCSACRSEGHTKRNCPLRLNKELYEAAKSGNAQQVARFLADGADTNYTDRVVGTPTPLITHIGTVTKTQVLRIGYLLFIF